MDSIMYTFYLLESKNVISGHYYYFAGSDNAGNDLITDEPKQAVGFKDTEDVRKFLKKRPSFAEQFKVQKMITNVEPHLYVER